MLKIENVEVVGWEHAIRGMRNPKNSWDRSDTVFVPDTPRLDYHGNVVEIIPAHYTDIYKPVDESDSFVCESGLKPECSCCEDRHTDKCVNGLIIGPNDHTLMMSLAKGGPVHAKYRRFIVVYLDIIAPLYWWKEFDTYKVGTVANSCSTMHKIHDKEFVLEDFSTEHLFGEEDILEFGERADIDEDIALAAVNVEGEHCYFTPKGYIQMTCNILNRYRKKFLECTKKLQRDLTDAERKHVMAQQKRFWWQMIQLLPSSYNQRRTIILNYEVLTGIYEHRKDHKLDEWHVFCDWIKSLPYSEIIIGEEK